MNKYMLLALMFIAIAAKPDEPSILNSGILFINSDGSGELSRLDFSKEGDAANLLRGTTNGLSSTGVSYPALVLFIL